MKGFYYSNNEYVFCTGKSPQGFKNVVFIIWSCANGVWKEGITPSNRLGTKIQDSDVPDDVWNAVAQASNLFQEREAEDDKFLNYVSHVASGLDIATSCAASGFIWDDEPQKHNTKYLPVIVKRNEHAKDTPAWLIQIFAAIVTLIIWTWLFDSWF